MNRQEIERAFVEAGWELDGGFSEHLVIGEDRHLSILAYPEAWNTGNAAFELCDGEGEVTCWVREIPTPRRAEELLEEHGEPSEEEWGVPHEQTSCEQGS